MSTELDLDDVAAQSPLAKRELGELRATIAAKDAEIERLKELLRIEAAKREEAEERRPYWLWRGMLERLRCEKCDNEEEDGCAYSGGCITEWCVPCAAEVFLAEIDKREELPNVQKPEETREEEG